MAVKTVTVNGRTYEILGFYREEQFEQVEINGEVWEIPRGWRVATGYDIFEIVDKDTRRIGIEPGKKYMLVTVKLYGKGVLLRRIGVGGEDIKARYMFKVQAGDFIFSKIDARNGAYGFIPPSLDNAVVTSDFPILTPRPGTYHKYIDITLKRPVVWETIRTKAAGSTNRRRVRVDDFLDTVHVPIPPLPEQIAIASVLSDIDTAIQKAEEAIKAAEELKKSMMYYLFTHGTRNQPRKQVEINGEVWEIPRGWGVMRLEEIARKMKAGGTPSRRVSIYWNGEIPFVKIEDIVQEGKYLKNTSETISDIGVAQSSAWIVPKNSILLAMYASMGEVTINKIPVATNQAIIAIVPDPIRADTEYLYYWLRLYKPIWKKFAKSTTQPNLTAKIIRLASVPLPPLPEQREIAGILSAIDRMIEKLKERKRGLEEMKKSVMHELLTGRVRAIVREVGK